MLICGVSMTLLHLLLELYWLEEPLSGTGHLENARCTIGIAQLERYSHCGSLTLLVQLESLTSAPMTTNAGKL